MLQGSRQRNFLTEAHASTDGFQPALVLVVHPLMTMSNKLSQTEYLEAIVSLAFYYGAGRPNPTRSQDIKRRADLVYCYIAAKVAASPVKCSASTSLVRGDHGKQIADKVHNFVRKKSNPELIETTEPHLLYASRVASCFHCSAFPFSFFLSLFFVLFLVVAHLPIPF
jgi:hypothetical protein